MLNFPMQFAFHFHFITNCRGNHKYFKVIDLFQQILDSVTFFPVTSLVGKAFAYVELVLDGQYTICRYSCHVYSSLNLIFLGKCCFHLVMYTVATAWLILSMSTQQVHGV